MKLSVHLVTWNGAKYIPYLFDSLRKQTFLDWKLIIWDNNSEDKTVELIKNELNTSSFSSEIIENKENIGFSGGHNELFKKCNTDYFLLLNQDMYLEPDCLEKMVKFLDNQIDTAVISPRLMRWLFSEVEAGRLENSFSDYVDSLGLKICRNRRVVELNNQENWSTSVLRHKSDLEVFGVSGALPMFRKKLVDNVKFADGNIFDPLFHIYKEDVDLAWRLRIAGYKAVVILDAIAFHDRTGAGPRELDDRSARINKKKQSFWIRYHSYKNQLIMLMRNEDLENFKLDFPWILWYEIKKFFYFLLFDRKVLKGLGEIWRNREKIKEQRTKINGLRKTDYQEIRKWFV